MASGIWIRNCLGCQIWKQLRMLEVVPDERWLPSNLDAICHWRPILAAAAHFGAGVRKKEATEMCTSDCSGCQIWTQLRVLGTGVRKKGGTRNPHTRLHWSPNLEMVAHFGGCVRKMWPQKSANEIALVAKFGDN